MNIRKHYIPLALLLASASMPGLALPEVLKSVDFNASSQIYGFGNRFVDDLNYTHTYNSAGGFNGTGGAHLVMHQGRDQFRSGWYWDGAKPGGGWTWNDTVYIRFRIRFDDNYRWDGTGSQQNKMIDFGGDSGSRVIFHNERPRPTTPCGLNYVDYTQSGNPVYNTPADYGLPANAFDTGEWGGFSLKNGIDFPCTKPVIVTHGQWYHVQFAVKVSSAAGVNDGFFKVWLNNNNATAPSSQTLNIVRELMDWNSSWDFGGYWTNNNGLRDQGWVVDDFQVATTFDPNWYPGGTVTPVPTEPPPAPAPSVNTGLPLNESFDAGNWNAWGGIRGNLTFSTQNCMQGTRCGQSALVANTDDNNYADYYFADHVGQGGDKVEEVYMQMYSKFDPGYVWPNRSHKIALLNLTDGVTSDRRYQVYVYVDPTGRYAVDHSNIATWQFFGHAQNIGTPVTVRSGQWDKLKLYTKLNTPGLSDGIIRLWVNDQLKVSYENVNIRENTNYGMNKFILSSYSTNATGSNGLQWYDDLVVSQTDPGSTIDTVAPQAPVLINTQ